MLISHRKNFIYTKTVKTAGTSVESYFEKYCMPDGEWRFSHGRDEYVNKAGIVGYRGGNTTGKKWYNHMPAIEIRGKLGASIWDKYFKFCVIRNPFDKLLSSFFWNKNIEKTEDLIGSFRKWILSKKFVPVDRDKYIIDGDVCIDYFIRYENLENDISHVCDLLDMPFEPENIPQLKSGLRKKNIPVRYYYDDKTLQIVESIYELELQLFKYDMPK